MYFSYGYKGPEDLSRSICSCVFMKMAREEKVYTMLKKNCPVVNINATKTCKRAKILVVAPKFVYFMQKWMSFCGESDLEYPIHGHTIHILKL